MVFERGNRPETRSTQEMLPLEDPDRIQIAFDDHRLVNNAGAAPSGHSGPARGPA